MCGIVGVFGEVGYKEEAAFRDMLYADVVRGPHSTGYIGVCANGAYRDFKSLGTPETFFKECDDFSDKGVFRYKAQALIGHNRFATQGAVNAENAHPFDTENAIGVHNGTLDWGWERNLDKGQELDVDSQALYEDISSKGLRKTIGSVAGAWSLVYFDKKTETIEFLRNSQRPMFYCYTKNKKTILFASEPCMIKYAAERQKITLAGEPVATTPNMRYSHDIKVLPKDNDGKAHFIFHKNLVLGKTYVAPKINYGSSWVNSTKESKKPGNVGYRQTNTSQKRNFIGNTTPATKQLINVMSYGMQNDVENSMRFFNIEDSLMVRVVGNTNSPHRLRIEDELKDDASKYWYQGFANQTILDTKTGEPIYYVVQANSISTKKEWDEYCWEKTTTPKDNPTKTVVEEKEESNFVKAGTTNMLISKALFTKMINKGCGHCTDATTTVDDASKIKWLGADTYLCKTCTSDPKISEQLSGM